MLLSVSYELIKLQATEPHQDLVNNLLNGQVKPDILRELIDSNFFNVKTGIVEPKKDKFYRMVISEEMATLQYLKSN